MRLSFVLAAVLAIVGALSAPGGLWLHYVTKPLATAILIGMVAGKGGAYARAIAVGLCFALAGDIALMLPGDYFLLGLGCFFLTHCAYLIALTRDCRLAARPAIFATLALVAAAMVVMLWPGLAGGMRLPVIAYALVLAAMAAQALSRAQVLGTAPARLAGLGSVLFLFSDSVLAWNEFRGAVPFAPVWVLGSYYAAQWCFAGSARR